MTEQIDHSKKILALNAELQLLGSLDKESIEYLIEQAAAAEIFRVYNIVLAQAAGAYRDIAESDIEKLEDKVDLLTKENDRLRESSFRLQNQVRELTPREGVRND